MTGRVLVGRPWGQFYAGSVLGLKKPPIGADTRVTGREVMIKNELTCVLYWVQLGVRLKLTNNNHSELYCYHQ